MLANSRSSKIFQTLLILSTTVDVLVVISQVTDNCPEQLTRYIPMCDCNSKNSSNSTIEYSIVCDQSGVEFQSPLLIGPVDSDSPILNQLIRSITISNQQLIHIEPDIIETTSLAILELNLIDDSIQTISMTPFSYLVDLKKLTITGNQFKLVDLGIIRQLVNLEVLDMSNNKIVSIGLRIGKEMMNLKEINLGQNALIELGDFRDFVKLKKIDLSNNFIENISTTTFAAQTNLEILVLSANSLSVIEPYAFASLLNLQELYLDLNDLTQIDASLLSGLSKLRLIKLDGNKLVEIMSNSFVSISIDKLDLSFQNIITIESGAINRCNKLAYIKLANNQIQKISPGFVADMQVIEKIDLSGNVIDKVDYDAFGKLDQLMTLGLNDNYISSIERGAFVNLSNLRNLFLFGNLLREINSEMFIGIEQLAKLDISQNKITTINANTFDNLPNLGSLYLQSNYITMIEPLAFAKLTLLTDLELGNNQLVEITPNMFSGLSCLFGLTLYNNKIVSIAKNAFSGMSNIIYVELGQNQIRTLGPGVFDGLDSLEMVSLVSNNLETIDGAFDNLYQLYTIDLRSNRLHRIDNHTFPDNVLPQEMYLSSNPFDEFVDKKVFDRLGRRIQLLEIKSIYSNPSEFLNLSSYKLLDFLDVSFTKFEVVADTFDIIADSLHSLYLRKVNLRNLTYLPMHRMKKLKAFDISDNTLDWSMFCSQNATTRFFRTHPDLNDVYLSNTSLPDLACLGISNLVALNTLDVSNNLIETIQPGTFKFNCTQYLSTRNCFTSLILSNNRLKLIQPGSFDLIQSLGTLSLDGNLLLNDNQLANVNFRFLNWLSLLDLSNMNLTRLPLFDSYLIASGNKGNDGYQVQSMKLAHNRIESIGSVYFDYLDALIELDLSDNRIARVDPPDVFYGSPKLKTLDLSWNLIDTVALNSINFKYCSNLKMLNLSHNSIDRLGSFLFDQLKKLDTIDVSYNPIIQIDAYAFNGLITLKNLYVYSMTTSTVVSSSTLANTRQQSTTTTTTTKSLPRSMFIQENFTSGCDLLKFVHVSSIDLIRGNLATLSSSLRAVAANKVVNEAAYYYSINIIVNNFDYYKSDRKSACELTIQLLKLRIHVNLFDDFDFDVFLANCYTLDLIVDP